jgi:hypothetical protein
VVKYATGLHEEAHDPVPDRPRAGAHLQRGGHKEAAAGKHPTLHIAEERLTHRRQLSGSKTQAWDLTSGFKPPPRTR